MYFLIKYFRTLEKNFNKIAAFILITTLILACNAEKRVPDGKQLLMKKSNHGATKEEYVFNQLYQNQTALYYWLSFAFEPLQFS
jgi:hypothetical protein